MIRSGRLYIMRRNSNKKLLIVTWWKPILGIVLFLSVVFAPVVVGVYTDSVIKRNLQVLIGNNSTIKLVSYTRSFFHSTAIISFNGSKSSLRATLTIDHGPYLFIYNDNITDKPYIGLAKGSYTLVATPATQKHLMKYFGRQKLVTGDFTIDFDGNIINKYKTAAMHYNNKSQNVIINWPGLSGEMTITKNTKQISNRVTISGVAVSAEHNHIAISNSMLFSTATLGPMNFWLDNITFSLGSVVASARDQDYINLKQLTFNTTTVAANATQLRYADEFSIKKLVVFGQNYAPVSSVTSVKPINIAVLQKLITLINNPKNDSPIKVIRLITEGVLLVDNGSKIYKTLTVNTPP